MILRTSDPAEKQILDWFQENFGLEDTQVVIDWVWSRERATGRYVQALALIAGKTIETGREFFTNCLIHARRPATYREAEEQIMAAMLPHVEKARINVLGHRGDPMVVEESMRELRVYLRENIRRMWPDKHRATIDGAIMSATKTQGAEAFIDFRRLVEVINMPDALATTASQSHGVSEDR